MKIKISDMLDHTNINSDELEPMKAAEVNTERLKHLTFEKINHQEKGNGTNMNAKKFSSKVLLIAAVICALTVTAFATVRFNWDKSLLNYFKPSEVQKEQLSEAGLVVGKSVTVNDLTLEVKQVLGDKYGVYVLCDVTAPENISLTDKFMFEQIRFDIPSKSFGYGYTILDDDNPADNKRSYIFDLNSESKVQGEKVSLFLKNLGYYTESKSGDEEPDFETVIEGKWEVSWDLNYTDVSKTISVNKPINIFDGISTIKAINISPLSLSVIIEGESVRKHDVMPPPITGTSDDIEIGSVVSVALIDGTVLNFDGFRGTGCGIRDSKLIFTCNFANIIDLDKVENITVGDISIPIR